MNIEAPTFNALNKPQKRALILRDQLRFLDPHHLDSFLQGISENEPPTYTKVNGVIKPELALVTLKEEAAYFDLGNVQSSENNNGIHRVYLVAESGQIQVRMEDPLPLDDNVLDSLPIHGFIARGMIPLFKEKLHAIQFRANKINEVRRAAYKRAEKTLMWFHEEGTLTRPKPSKTKQVPAASPSKPPTKPRPNQEIKQHISKSISEDAKDKILNVKPLTSNKRKRAALETIPEKANSSILDTIPSDTKVSLFNTMINTAFPHLDQLITASRNVVSTYSTCSSDIAALHGTIDALQRALQDFNETCGQRTDREILRSRHDFETGTPSTSLENNNSAGRSSSRSSICHTTTISHATSPPPDTFQPSTPAAPCIPAVPQSSPSSNRLPSTSSFSSSSSSSSSSSPSTILPPCPSHTSSPQRPSAPPHTSYTSITAMHHESVLRFQPNSGTTRVRRTGSLGSSSGSSRQAGFLGSSKGSSGGGGGSAFLGPRNKAAIEKNVAPVVNMVPVARREEGQEEDRDQDGMEG